MVRHTGITGMRGCIHHRKSRKVYIPASSVCRKKDNVDVKSVCENLDADGDGVVVLLPQTDVPLRINNLATLPHNISLALFVLYKVKTKLEGRL